MVSDFKTAHIAGFECLTAWSDLLDKINVFPVADGDTGRNLLVSLAPLRFLDNDREKTIHQLMLQARGNSGNIAARFFAGFLEADSGERLLQAARGGRDLACQAVYHPLPGTMLTVFEALAEHLEAHKFIHTSGYAAGLLARLERAVKSTPDLLPRLKSASVVDSGALGMFIFFSGFFSSLTGAPDAIQPVTETFKGQLRVQPSFRENHVEGHCVDTLIRLDEGGREKIKTLSEYGESVVIIPHKDYVKVHFHTHDAKAAEDRIKSFGKIVKWSDDNLGLQSAGFRQQQTRSPVHIMTDAAGSLTREDARNLGFTLLDSYITAGGESLPETRFSASHLYQSMRRGVKVSTSQASVFERQQHYQRVVRQYPRVLYLSVGSVFTGNYGVAMEWKQKNDPENRLTVIDTAAASGRLGTITLATARFAAQSNDFEAVVEFAKNAVDQCKEYVFLDKLKYLAAGGRLSKSGAFFGDMFRAKPIISPVAEGAKKVGLVKNRKEQLAFALAQLGESFTKASAPFIMLEYSDNYAWVDETVRKEIEILYPLAEIRVQPLSLTSGAHMGPGTWGVAFLPGFSNAAKTP